MYLCLFGSTGITPAFASLFEPCRHDCNDCCTFQSDLYAYADGGPKPTWHHHVIRTSVAAGADNFRPELLRWFGVASADGTESPDGTFQLRLRVATAVALGMNKVQRDGLTDAQAVSIIYPLLKPPKPGQSSDPANPTSYRFIAVSTVLSKALALAIASRLTHFADCNGLLPFEQAGFRARQGAEHHVWALSNLLRARRRAGQSTYALYIDFEKAYDRVNPAALAAVLDAMGVPTPMVELIRRWRAGRRGAVFVNGVSTSPFDLASGVPQGCPLSPLLFSLFLSSLSSYLDSVPGLTGAGFRGLTFRRLAYADDVVILSTTAHGLQLALDHVHLWAAAWGMTVSVGPSKTQAQHFPSTADSQLKAKAAEATAASSAARAAFTDAVRRASAARRGGAAAALLAADSELSSSITSFTAASLAADLAVAAAPPPLPALFLNGVPVDWVEQYRYLGATLRSDLDDAPTVKRMLSVAAAAFSKLFTHRPVIRRLCIAAQLQLLRTHVLGAAEYLRSVTDPYGALGKEMDMLALTAARGILRLPPGTSNDLVWALSGLLPSAASSARAWLRLRLQLHDPPFVSPATLLFRVLRVEPVSPISIAGADANWVHVTSNLLTYHVQCGAMLSRPVDYSDIARTSAVFGRSIALISFRSGLVDPLPAPAPAVQPQPALTGPVPSARGSKRHAAALFCHNEHMAAAVTRAGTRHHDNPLSAAGPGLRSLVSTSLHATPPYALLAALQGAQALHLWPFAPPPATARLRRAHRPRADAPPAALPYKNLFTWSHCRLCGAGGPDEDVFHVALICPHPALRVARAPILSSLRNVVRGVWIAVSRALSRRNIFFDIPDGPERGSLTAYLGGAYLPPDELQFIAYRLLMAAPWPASEARARGFLAAAAIGVIFDNGYVGELRRPCNGLVTWADDRLTTVAKAWRAVCAGP